MCPSQTSAASKLLPLWHGSQQAIDATIGSPVTRAGEAQPGADAQPGQALIGATCRKRRQTHPKLVRARRCRWCRSRRPVQYRSGHVATSGASNMQSAARSAWVARWSGLLAVAARSAFAASFPELPLAGETLQGKRPSRTKSSPTCAGSSPSLPAGYPLSRLGPGCSIPRRTGARKKQKYLEHPCTRSVTFPCPPLNCLPCSTANALPEYWYSAAGHSRDTLRLGTAGLR